MQLHPQPAHKERPFLPSFKRPGPPGPFSVDWVKPPHLYQAGRIIVIYIGTNASLLHLLVGILGKQFAGM
jgi:hypothetical protein